LSVVLTITAAHTAGTQIMFLKLYQKSLKQVSFKDQVLIA